MKQEELQIMRTAGKITTEIMHALKDLIEPGITGEDVNRYAGELCIKHKVKPAFLGVPSKEGPFPGNLCLSLNEEVLHAIPTASQVVKSGDLVSIDFGVIYEGHYTDNCITVGVEKVDDLKMRLLETGRLAVLSAAKKAKAGVNVGEISYTQQSVIELAGFHVVKTYVGHGIGKTLWENPEVPAWGDKLDGPKLRSGQVICIEAQVIAGTDQLVTAPDGWTLLSKDGSPSVMFEYMVEVTKHKANILTPTYDWDLIV